MAKESFNDPKAFTLKAGGAKEDANPTDLGMNEYSEAVGFADSGTVMRMPGKRLVTQYQAPVHQIAAFGNAVLIQHGATLDMYPDACAVAPVPEETPPPPQTNYQVDFNVQGAVYSGLAPGVMLLLYNVVDTNNPLNNDYANLLHSWSWNDLDPNTDSTLPNLDFGSFLPALPCNVRFATLYGDLQTPEPDIRLLIHTIIGDDPYVTSQGPYISISAQAGGVLLGLSGLD